MKVFEWFETKMEALGDRIGSPFELITDWMETAFETKVTGAVEQVLEDFEHELTIPLQPIFIEVLKNPNIPDDVRKLIEEAQDPKHFGSAAILAAAAAIGIMPAMGAAMSGGIEQIRQGSMSTFKPSLMSPDEAIAAFWRGKFSAGDLSSELSQHGYNKDRQDLLEEVRRYVPNASDLIRFTVRDVFREDIVKKYEYDTGFDDMLKDLGPWMDKIGMDPAVMRLFWRSHWALPSVGQAFDMLHRGQIKEDDIRTLLRISDVAPAWIEPIIKVAYSPYTRVDVRRMYVSGILDKGAVMRSYLDLGYDEEHANNMTEWTIAESMSSERDLSKSEIISAYKQGALNVGDTESALTDMGYDNDEAKLIIAIQDYKTEVKILNSEKKILIKQFARGDLLVDDLKKGLSALGLSEKEISITVEDARSKVREKTASPTKADLIKWLGAKIISKDAFIVEMRLKGYSQPHIDNYLKAEG